MVGRGKLSASYVSSRPPPMSGVHSGWRPGGFFAPTPSLLGEPGNLRGGGWNCGPLGGRERRHQAPFPWACQTLDGSVGSLVINLQYLTEPTLLALTPLPGLASPHPSGPSAPGAELERRDGLWCGSPARPAPPR